VGPRAVLDAVVNEKVPGVEILYRIIYLKFCNYKFVIPYNLSGKSRDNSVGIALGYGLDDRSS
jgi:hypothetical protein